MVASWKSHVFIYNLHHYNRDTNGNKYKKQQDPLSASDNWGMFAVVWNKGKTMLTWTAVNGRNVTPLLNSSIQYLHIGLAYIVGLVSCSLHHRDINTEQFLSKNNSISCHRFSHVLQETVTQFSLGEWFKSFPGLPAVWFKAWHTDVRHRIPRAYHDLKTGSSIQSFMGYVRYIIPLYR